MAQATNIQVGLIPQFKGDNFGNWLFRLKCVMEEKGCNVVLEENHDLTADEFNRRDAKARNIIVQALTDGQLEYIREAKTAKDMIANLEKVYERKSILSSLYLRRKLMKLTCNPDDSLLEHFINFDKIIRELESTGSKLEEADKVCYLLLTLPEMYEPIITALETTNVTLTLEYTKNKLLDAELKYKNKENRNIQNENFSFATEIKKCFICGNTKHFAKDCPNKYSQSFRSRGRSRYNRGRGFNRGRSQYRNTNQINQANERCIAAEEDVVFIAANLSNQKDLADKNIFVLDSGASNHFVKDELKRYMYDLKVLEHDINIYMANGQVLKANTVGKLHVRCQNRNITIEALVVPGIKNNLLSAAKLTSRGHWIIVEKNCLSICGKNFSLICKNVKGLYILKFDSFIQEQCNHAVADDAVLWHKRLGHAGENALKQLGLPVPTEKCSTCFEAKATRLPFHCNEKRSHEIGELIHSDICGPITPSSINGEKYFQVILDDYSHFLIVKLLRNKNEAEENLKNYVQEVERQHGVKVKKLRLDNGGEFITNTFKNFCTMKGIKLEYTMTYSPQMNGKAERINRTVVTMIRSKIIDSGVPKSLWGEALNASAYELNRTPTTALEKGKTPAMIWYGRNDMSKLRVFGCRAWTTILPKQNKLGPRAKLAVMIGYCGGGYRLWIPSEDKIIMSRDVRFEETRMQYKEQENKVIPISINEEEKESDPEKVQRNEKVKIEINTNDIIENIDEENITSTENNENSECESNKNITKTISRSGRNITKPKRLDDYEIYTAYCLLSATDEEPKTYNEASKSDEWLKAINKELDSHDKLQTWTPSNLPNNQVAIDTRWIFKIKEDGTKKARLVAKGFQVPIDEEDFSYAPVCRLSTIRILISISIQKDWSLTQIDVPTAFLNGFLDNEVYIKTPEGLKCDSKYLKLSRSLYGLRNAPKCWNIKFSEVMSELEFKRSEYDYCLYTKDEVYLVLFVDDALITGPCEKVDNLVKNLYKIFEVKSMANVKTFLGMEITQIQTGLKLSQTKMINHLLEKFGMNESRTISTPMEVNFQLDENKDIESHIPYRRLICSLMYLSIVTRPDIAYSVSYLSRYLDKPTMQAWEAGKRILRYLNSTKNYGLIFTKGEKGLEGMCDADWGGDRQTRKSVSGFVCFHSGNPISWHSRKQNCVALSSMEAEYISAGLAAQELVNLKGILSEFKELEPAILKIDNLSAISLIKNFENSKRGKHIEIKYHFIKDLYLKKQILINYVCSKENCADLFTKALGKEKFVKFRSKLLRV